MKACRLRASICHTQCRLYAFCSIAQDRSYIHEGPRGCGRHDWRSRGWLAVDDEPNTSQVGESGTRRHCQSCSNLVERLMRAGECRFVALVHGVGLVVPSFARAVLHGERQRRTPSGKCKSTYLVLMCLETFFKSLLRQKVVRHFK